ncbi:DUF1835 domain-containing protein [Paenibacillus alkalitolerans]|uniref:DUF1835 domain-containing protein n=1 Tax=Paenibacillus alkalitolerans TaxID=2799335 RepID=UPI0018F2DA52|nr:DUF1835 domain-containing protein [Paenibacillus alkalitolerans]
MRTHILETSAGMTLKQVFKDEEINERIVLLPDDLMLGPLGNIFLKDVQEQRLQWWERIFSEEDKRIYMDFLHESYQNFNHWIQDITDKDSLLFWVGDSVTEYTGMMCLLAYLPDSIPVSVIMASSAYYKRYGGFKPFSAGEITPGKMLPLLEEAKSLSPRVREKYVNNWMQLLKDDGILRIRKNRQIEMVSEDYFDELILALAKKISHQKMYRNSNGFFPAMRLVGEVVGRSKQKIIDTFIEWRLRCLIQSGHLAYEGSLTSMRLYKIKPATD